MLLQWHVRAMVFVAACVSPSGQQLAAVCCWESCPEIYLNRSGAADIRKDRNILPSAVSDGGNTSDSLTHTSVGSWASALRAKYTQMHTSKHTSARPQLCFCDSSPKSDNLAADRKRTCLDSPKWNLCSEPLDMLWSESQCISISLKIS